RNVLSNPPRALFVCLFNVSVAGLGLEGLGDSTPACGEGGTVELKSYLNREERGVDGDARKLNVPCFLGLFGRTAFPRKLMFHADMEE
ncbi:hypothetical protein BC827DRAFT_1252854, partial [Russula dissimulans]